MSNASCHPHFAGSPGDPTSSVDVRGVPEPAFELASPRDYFGDSRGHDGCHGCHTSTAKVVLLATDERLCLDCAGLSQCGCGAIVPAGTLDPDTDRCPACEAAAELLTARRALLVALARAASIVAATPRKVVTTTGVEVGDPDDCGRCNGSGEIRNSMGMQTCPVCRGSALSGSGEAALRRAV